MKSKRTKALDITQKVKLEVAKRDTDKFGVLRCIICGNSYNVMPNSHFIRRSHSGLGIEQNIFTACTNFTENKCHYRWDNYLCTDEEIERVKNHFKYHYPDWNEDILYYKKKY